jgi:Asp-tRNA(Asn)/Glu-tRNA(Gln) amidotransferase A subunit family amidase
MRRQALRFFALLVPFALCPLLSALHASAPQSPFNVVEASIADVHAAFRTKTLTCRALVDAYLTRIAAFDKQGPALNAVVVTNPEATKTADELDRRFAANGPVGPLHCVPMVVKDNFETIGLQSANGSKSLEGFVSAKDAFQVARIKAAGAIVIAKTNMAEFAFSPYESLSSIQGHTKNPYALDRVPAGSSGGTAAAVAGSFATVGLGSDTGNSIRGPSAHTALVGIRSTMGLTSRAGVIPLSYLADIAGPMARTMEDAVTVFQVIVGEDPDDPVTARSRGRAIPDYRKSLVRDGLKGARIGILRQAYERTTTDEEVVKVFMQALEDMKKAGAEIVDGITVERVQRVQGAGTCRGFKYDINDYLATRGQRAPVRNLDEIIASGKFDPSVQNRLQQAQRATPEGPDSEACRAEMAYREAFGAAVTKVMDDQRLDALVYPTWSNPPRAIGDLQSPHGDNSQVYSPSAGFPAITVPMGYTRDGQLPAGVTFLGRAWDEARLIRLGYSYEQATRHRRPPASTTPAKGADPAPDKSKR